MAEEGGGDKQIEQMVKMEMEARQKRFEMCQEYNKTIKEGFKPLIESQQMAGAVREKTANQATSNDDGGGKKDGVNFSRETQQMLQ